jgi:predicted nucleic acid-binding protein
MLTSTLTLTEVLVRPFRSGSYSLAERYFQILTTSRNFAVIPVSDVIAIDAARLRAEQGMKAPDAIQLATARIGGATTFVTNDAELPTPPNLRLFVLDQLIQRL